MIVKAATGKVLTYTNRLNIWKEVQCLWGSKFYNFFEFTLIKEKNTISNFLVTYRSNSSSKILFSEKKPFDQHLSLSHMATFKSRPPTPIIINLLVFLTKHFFS